MMAFSFLRGLNRENWKWERGLTPQFTIMRFAETGDSFFWQPHPICFNIRQPLSELEFQKV